MKQAGESMSKVDTAWLRMDSPSNLMMIAGVWTLRPGIRHEDLCRRVEERLLKYARFRQRVVEIVWHSTPSGECAQSHHRLRGGFTPWAAQARRTAGAAAGSADKGSDFKARSGRLVFASGGPTSRTINVQVKVAVNQQGKKVPMDFAKVAKILRDSGYRGYVVLEYEENEDPRTSCPEFMDQIRAAFIEEIRR